MRVIRSKKTYFANRRCPTALLAGVILSAGTPLHAFAQSVLYVDVDSTGPTHNGASWCGAYLTLHEALAVAGVNTTIRVANGSYTPKTTGLANPRLATFQLKNRVTIVGGYAGCGAANPDERNIQLHETRLTGDLLGNDGPDFQNIGENVYHVVTGSGTSQTAVLDGVSIIGGNANALDAPNDRGGGMLNEAGSPALSRCTFTGNSALSGGAMANRLQSRPTLTECVFSGNAAGNGAGMYNVESDPSLSLCTFQDNTAAAAGGGMSNDAASPVMTDCVFLANHANDGGGGIYNLGSAPTLDGCMFTDNTVVANGGAMLNHASDPVLTECHFTGNTAASGGAVYNLQRSFPRLANCLFNENSAADGGAMANRTNSAPLLAQCTFTENSSTGVGGAMSNDQSSPTIASCSFARNTASSTSGAIENRNNSGAIIVDCLFEHNTSGLWGGGMFNDSSNPLLFNCRFIGNSATSSGGFANATGSPRLTNCTFTGNSSTALFGGAFASLFPGNPVLTNCTFSGNVTGSDGGGIYFRDGKLTLTNCILWNNADRSGSGESAQLFVQSAEANVNHTCIQGLSGALGGIGNIGEDPLLVDADGIDNLTGTVDDNLRLESDSPCVDAANNTAVSADAADLDDDNDTGERVPLDLDGNPRFVDVPTAPNTGVGPPPIVDMGAYEHQSDCNVNGIRDAIDIFIEFSFDCNENGIPDECEIDAASGAPGGPFFCAIDCNPDCNENGVPDECEVPQIGAVESVWVAEAGLWNNEIDNANWCLPESPNNNEDATFIVTIDGPEAAVTLNTSPTVTSLSLLDGAVLVVSDASGANTRTLASDEGITNTGIFRATDRERLVLDAPVIDQMGECESGGVLEAADGVLGSGEGSAKSVLEINGAVVLGGVARTIGENSEIHLIGGAELVDVCIDGVVVPDGQTGGFSGTVTNNDVLTVRGTTSDTRLEPRTSGAVLDGSGCLRLTSQAFSRLGEFKSAFTNSLMHRIEGAGVTFGGLINKGMLHADVPNQELILFPPGEKTNDGTFLATDGGTLRISDDVIGTGSYLAEGGTIRVWPAGGTASLCGSSLQILGDETYSTFGVGRAGLVELTEDAIADLTAAVTINDGGELYLNDTTTLFVGEDLLLSGADDQTDCASVVAGGITPPPKIGIQDSSQVLVRGDLVLAQSTQTTNVSSIGVVLAGDFDNSTTFATCFQWADGRLTLNGTSPQVFEVAGRDLGPTLAGFGSKLDTNFSIGTVEITSGSDVSFTNLRLNTTGTGPCDEALYVRDLLLRAGSSITLDNARIYVEQRIDEGTLVKISGCGALVQIATGDANRDGHVDLLDWDGFSACMVGPNGGAMSWDCGVFDFDASGVIDLIDLREFQIRFHETQSP